MVSRPIYIWLRLRPETNGLAPAPRPDTFPHPKTSLPLAHHQAHPISSTAIIPQTLPPPKTPAPNRVVSQKTAFFLKKISERLDRLVRRADGASGPPRPLGWGFLRPFALEKGKLSQRAADWS